MIMSEDLDKLKQALRKGEYASLKTSSLENNAQKDERSITTESQDSGKSTKPKNRKSLFIYLIILLLVSLALVINQWQSEKAQAETKLEQLQKELSSVMAEKNQWQSENETGNTALQLAKEQISSLQAKVSSLEKSSPNALNLILKYKYQKSITPEVGFPIWYTHFYGFAEGDWNQDWKFKSDKIDTSLTQGEIYVVSLCPIEDDAGYTVIGYCGARIATPEERLELQRY